MLEVLSMVEGYCHLITERAFLLDDQKECPDELREAAAELVFASSRCGDLPELREVRRTFSKMFGEEFTYAAVELRNNCGVSWRMIQKFSTKQPSLEIRAKVVKEIAIEKAIKVELVDPICENTEVQACELPDKTECSNSCGCVARLEDDINSLRSEMRKFMQRFEMNYPPPRSSQMGGNTNFSED